METILQFLGLKSWFSSSRTQHRVQDEYQAYLLFDSQSQETRILKSVTKDDVDNRLSTIIKIRLSAFPQLLKALEVGQEKFVDKQFPPLEASLGDFGGKEKRIQWHRISQLTSANLFNGGFLNNALKNNPEDCYFLPAIFALFDKKPGLQRLFGRCAPSKGAFTINLKVAGVFTQIVIDQFVPTYSNQILFSGRGKKCVQTWPIVLQKAWAKLHGSYEAIAYGSAQQVLECFSPGPTLYFQIESDSTSEYFNWNLKQLSFRLEQASRQKSVVCAFSRQTGKQISVGLRAGYTYTVDLVFKLFSNQLLVRVVQPITDDIRWNGSFSQTDAKWRTISQFQKKQLDYKATGNKHFFILLQDFATYFQGISVCHVQQGFKYNSWTYMVWTHKASFYRLTITRRTKLYLSVFFQNKTEKKHCRKGILLLARLTQNSQFQYIGSASAMESESTNLILDQTLAEGNYFLYVKIDPWEVLSSAKQKLKITLATYCLDLPEIKMLDRATFKRQNPHFLQSMFIERAFSKRRMICLDPPLWYSQQFLINAGDFGYFVAFVDAKSTKKLTIAFDQQFFTSQGLRLKRPLRDKKGKQQIEVKCGQTKVIICRLRGKAVDLTFPPVVIKQSQ